MKRVGLTGNIGSGKTTVSRLFHMLDVPVYYADQRGRYFLNAPATIQFIKTVFGKEYLDQQGMPDRKKIAALVFNDRKKLDQLNAVIHPQVRADFDDWTAGHRDKAYVIMEAAILFESEQSHAFDKIILVTAPEDLRILRVSQRDGSSADEVRQRMKNQMPEEEKILQADYVINNDGAHLLMPQVEKIHAELTALSQSAGDK
ncbi:MAG: dephospho-CoA kinase [Bacteroidales bacterium]|nr:dephospho-CoA kinase [Bacteroidales bacterium]